MHPFPYPFPYPFPCPTDIFHEIRNDQNALSGFLECLTADVSDLTSLSLT